MVKCSIHRTDMKRKLSEVLNIKDFAAKMSISMVLISIFIAKTNYICNCMIMKDL